MAYKQKPVLLRVASTGLVLHHIGTLLVGEKSSKLVVNQKYSVIYRGISRLFGANSDSPVAFEKFSLMGFLFIDSFYELLHSGRTFLFHFLRRLKSLPGKVSIIQ